MNPANSPTAFGAPGIEPRWTASTKEGIGTAYNTSSRVWFTLSHGIIDEIYYPHVDVPNTRDLQFLITDGETFCHEERRHLDHKIEYPKKGLPALSADQLRTDWAIYPIIIQNWKPALFPPAHQKKEKISTPKG